MEFDKEEKLAYVAHSNEHPGDNPSALWFEQLFGEVVSECVSNNWKFADYIERHIYKSDAQLKDDFKRDYEAGVDYRTNTGAKVNSKIVYRKGNNVYVNKSLLYYGEHPAYKIDYISFILPEGDDLYLYFVSTDVCRANYDMEKSIVLLDDIGDQYATRIKLSSKQADFYNAGYSLYRQHNIPGLINKFTELTGYSVVEKLI